ncbi:RNA polymerase sigma-70 factor [Fulvivirgaceae bacterium BMA12]|uniref:RNA polymerase sigma-70 factor n=1 Tax=Agaribacillus aureus TaxID=3051825 RepID=A0ABT8KZN5_9BACT|nr:RNA polymerase sigma-70 factor [Fulvivirgaceae bacterium BMA12]
MAQVYGDAFKGEFEKTSSPNLTEEIFEEIYNKYFDRLFSYALGIVKSEDLAKDVVSEIFLNLWTQSKSIKEIKQLDSYLFVAVKNQSFRILGKEARFNQIAEFASGLSTKRINTPEELFIGKELYEIIESAVKTLPEQCRLVFELVKSGRLKHEEVAKELDISKNTVKNHMVNAIKRIRVQLQNHLYTSDKSKMEIEHVKALLLLILIEFIW